MAQGLILIVRNFKYLKDRPKEMIKTAPSKKKNKKKSNAEAAAKPSKAAKPAYQHISYKGQKKQKAQQKAAAEAADTVVQLVEEEQAWAFFANQSKTVEKFLQKNSCQNQEDKI